MNKWDDPTGPMWFGNDPRLPEGPAPAQDRRQEALASLQTQLHQSGHYSLAESREEALRMVRSAEPGSLEKITLKKGDHVYAYASCPTAAEAAARGSAIGKRDSSAFYMTEATFQEVQRDCGSSGKLDPAQVRDGHALPSGNACNQVVRREVLQDHEVWVSRCGPMSDLAHVRNSQGYLVVSERTMPGGREQIFCISAKDPAQSLYGPREDFTQQMQLAKDTPPRAALQQKVDAQEAAAKQAGTEHQAGVEHTADEPKGKQH